MKQMDINIDLIAQRGGLVDSDDDFVVVVHEVRRTVSLQRRDARRVFRPAGLEPAVSERYAPGDARMPSMPGL